jgi:hypothetical protein
MKSRVKSCTGVAVHDCENTTGVSSISMYTVVHCILHYVVVVPAICKV